MWWKIVLAAVVAVILLAALALWIAGSRFDARMDAEVAAMLAAAAPTEDEAIDLARYPGLPEPVRRYLDWAGVDGRTPIDAARMRHGGTFSTDNGESWLPIRGEEYFTVAPPGFIWRASVPMLPGVRIRVRDRYSGGAGNMYVTVGGLVVLEDAQGPELASSALVRYLGELTIMPTALVPGGRLSWEPVDSASARAVFRDEGLEVEATFHFDEDGAPVRFTTMRYRAEGDSVVLRPFVGRNGNFREVDGFRIPTRWEVAWVLDGEEAPYVRFDIETVTYGLGGVL